jgi:hypothetical protein
MHRECQTKRNSFSNVSRLPPEDQTSVLPWKAGRLPDGTGSVRHESWVCLSGYGFRPIPTSALSRRGGPRGLASRLSRTIAVVGLRGRFLGRLALDDRPSFPDSIGVRADLNWTRLGCRTDWRVPASGLGLPNRSSDGRSPLIGTAGREQSGQTLRPQPIHGSRPVEFAPDVVQDSACLFRVSAISSSEART